jgi:hypothetical protein
MSYAALYLAGESDLAGEAPVEELSDPRNVAPPIALVFDGETRTFLRDDDGFLKSIHPVDQKVALALLMQQKKIAPAPKTGSTLREIKYIEPAKIETDVTDRINRALTAVLQPGDIEILKLEVLTPSRWAGSVTFQYKNLREPGSTPRTITLTSTNGN